MLATPAAPRRRPARSLGGRGGEGVLVLLMEVICSGDGGFGLRFGGDGDEKFGDGDEEIGRVRGRRR